MWLNVGCGTHRAPAPWWNIDTVIRDDIRPDQLVDPDGPLPFDTGSCDRVLLSHVLEHVPWEQVPSFLRDVRRVCSGTALVVGPDVHRTIRAYKAGEVHWELVTSVLEHKDWPDDMAGWPGAPHHWNSHESRVVEALTRTGWSVCPASDEDLADWPLVGWSRSWQFALVCEPC